MHPITKTMTPFAGYDDFDDCVSDNQDKDSPEGFCAWLHYETTGEWPTEGQAQGKQIMNDLKDKLDKFGQYNVVRKTFKNQRGKVIKSEKDGEGDFIKIPISSVNEDRDYDNFSMAGLNDMLEQIKGGHVGMYLDHGMRGYFALDMIGVFKDGEIIEDTLYANAMLDEEDERAIELKRKTDKGLPIGYSVSFIPLKYDEKDNGGKEFHKSDLLEVSAVGIPCNPDMINPYGKSKVEAIVKSILQENNMTKEEEKPKGENEDDDGEEEQDAFKQAVNVIAEQYGVEPNKVLEVLETLEMEDEDDDTEEDNKTLDEKQIHTIGTAIADKVLELINQTPEGSKEKKKKPSTPKTIVLPDEGEGGKEGKQNNPEDEKSMRFKPNY